MTARFRYRYEQGSFEATFRAPYAPMAEAAQRAIAAAGAIVKAEGRADIAAAGLGAGFVKAPAAPENSKAAESAAPKERKPREGTKQSQLIDLLRRPKGATLAEIVEVTGWQQHTIRGAMAGALKKKLGLTITSEKIEGRGRVYRLTD